VLPLKFLAIAQSVLVQLAINHGLGRMEDNLVHSDFVLYQKVTCPQSLLFQVPVAKPPTSTNMALRYSSLPR
jgi:hypothetical protein